MHISKIDPKTAEVLAQADLDEGNYHWRIQTHARYMVMKGHPKAKYITQNRSSTVWEVTNENRPRVHDEDIANAVEPKGLVEDVTEFWNEDFLREYNIAKIEDIYVYDNLARVHLCSLQGNLEAYYVDFVITMEDGATEAERDRAFEDVLRYNNSKPVKYFGEGFGKKLDLGKMYDPAEWSCESKRDFMREFTRDCRESGLLEERKN